jgi:hypothetical protein
MAAYQVHKLERMELRSLLLSEGTYPTREMEEETYDRTSGRMHIS